MANNGDIFGRGTTYGVSNFVTSDYMKLQVGSNITGTEYLVQQVSVQYNQPLNRIYEIGSSSVYFAPGRAIGSCQLGRIIGSKNITQVLGDTGTHIWNANIGSNEAEKTIVFSKSGGSGTALTFKLSGCVVESYSVATDANGLIVQENVTIQFASLSFAGSGGSSADGSSANGLGTANLPGNPVFVNTETP